MDAQETQSFQTSSGIEVERVYNPRNVGPLDFEKKLGPAGEPPYTRGIFPNMYRGRLWTMRQYAGFGTARQTNRRFRWLLSQGQTGLSTAFDLPTQLGMDAEDPRARGEVGKVGVHIGTLEDMEELLEGIPLDLVSTSLTINATAPVLLAFYVAVAKKRGVPPEALRGTLQNDILKEYVARGAYLFAPGASLRLTTDTVEYATRSMPLFHPISISGYHIREAGADAAQEVAFTFADAKAYVQSFLDRGLSVDSFAPRLAFFFGCHNHFLEEIAKFRAARRIWRRIMEETYGAKDSQSLKLRFHVQTCGSTLTSRQPENNVLRVAYQAMAAVLGGAQSLHTNAYDEALALPGEESAALALRTQQILAFETGAADTVDPVGGAYAVEALTEKLEEKVWTLLREIESQGGMLAAIEADFPQRKIQEAAYRSQREIESGRQKVVGVNACAENSSPKKVRIWKAPKNLERIQRQKLRRFKQKRNAALVGEALRELAAAARQERRNLFPCLLKSVESHATLGEICRELEGVFGRYGHPRIAA
ncbi:MAG: methylmalonyl-CoA mutase [Elusimicrobia bacterium]|nr:methylmalonyl-CoA mutase [Elusimicrobiota bacterium]